MWGRGQAASGWNPEGNIPQLGQQLTGMNAAPTWSLDPNHYRQIPHNQVDWASLAQQWIQMKGTNVNQNQQVEGQSQEVAQAPPVPQHQTQVPSFQHQHQHHQDVIGEAPMDLDESVSTPLYTRSSAVAAGGIGTSPSPNVAHFSQHQPNQTWSQPTFHANQINEHLGRASASEFSGGNTYGNNSWMHSGVDFSNYNVNDRRYAANYTDRRQSYQEEETYEEDLAEAARRRALPSWIREGLEKVEREKRKAEEKERLAEQREEERRLRRKRDQEQTETSKWASDFDQPQVQPEAEAAEEPEPAVFFGADGDKEGFSIKLKGSFRQSQPRQLSLDEILASLTKDEQMEQVMLSVRRQLTKILLEVTNEEMRTVAVEALERAKAKQKVTSSRGQSLVALTSLTGGPLGLGDYGSDSEDQDDSSNSDAAPLEANEADSEDDLIAEIERKKRNFEMKLLADEEEENIKSRGKSSAEVMSRSRSKSGDSFPGTNGKSLLSSHSVSTTKPIAFQPEKSRGEEEKFDKKAERRRASRSRSPENRRRDSESSRRLSTSSRKEDKHDRSRSRERRRRSRSHSRGREVTHRSRSTSPHRDKARRRSRSMSKSRKDRRSRSSSKTKKDKRRRSRSSSKTKSKTKHSRSPSLSKSKNKKSRSRSSSKSKSKSKRRSRSSSTSRNSHRRSRSSSKSKRDRRRSDSTSRKGKKRRHQSRSTSPAQSRDKQRRTSDISKRRRRSASSSSSRSSSPSNSGKPTH